jgi:hypothetical protein
MQSRDESDGERQPITEEIRSAPIRLHDRWERAKAAGAEAESAEAARLTENFRTKVNDPEALTPPRPPGR